MKTIQNIILTVFMSVALYSCQDAIDIDPIGEITADVTFLTIDDLTLGLNGAYALLSPEGEIRINSVMSDNLKPGCASGGQEIPFYNWVVPTSQFRIRDMWNNFYILINQCNRVLEASVSISANSASEQAEINNILGQLRTLRAYAHFQMLQYFTTDATDDSALSIIIAAEVPVIDQIFPRNTNGEVYNFINADLDLAENLLAPSQTQNIFVTKDFITALRARMALTRGQNTEAIGFAQTLIDSYPLADQIQYINMFNDNDDTEVIFKAVRTPSDTFIGGIWYFTGSAGPFLESSRSLFNAHDPADVRFAVNLNLGATIDTECGPTDDSSNIHLVGKYLGNSVPFLADAKVFRVSEMHLIKAEAQAKENMLVQAAMTLQTLRNARFGGTTPLDSYTSSTEAIDAVFDERRLELAYEGHRFLDMKRLNKGVNRLASDCEDGGNCELPSSDFRFTFPIPQLEIDVNPNLVQNPGYTN